MTFAWYAHLRNLANRPWYIAAIASWGIALFEYLLQVPANRIGYTALSLVAAEDSAGSNHSAGVRAVCGAVHAAAAQAGLPLGRIVPAGRRVLRLPFSGNTLNRTRPLALAVALGLLASIGSGPGAGPDMGIPLDGIPGPLDAITDVPGVAVGHVTLIQGEGKLQVGVGPVRTGVTAVFPRGTADLSDVFAGWFSLNGNGEMTGTRGWTTMACCSTRSASPTPTA